MAEALGSDEAMARVEYRAWADGQHDMLRCTDGRLGMSDAEYAEVLVRAGEADPGSDASIGEMFGINRPGRTG